MKKILMMVILSSLVLAVYGGEAFTLQGYHKTGAPALSFSGNLVPGFNRGPLILGGSTYFRPDYYETTDDVSSGCWGSGSSSGTSSGCGDSGVSSSCGDGGASSGCGDGGVSSGCSDSGTTDADGELAAEILFNYLLFPSTLARAIAAHEQHEELRGDVRGSVIKNKSRNWTLFGFSSTFTLSVYVTLATLGYTFPLVGVVGFAAMSGIYFVHFIVSASLFGDSQVYWPYYNTYYNRSTTYYFISSAGTLSTCLATMFIYLGLLIFREYYGKKDKKKQEKWDQPDDTRPQQCKMGVRFSPGVFGLTINFSPYLFCRKKNSDLTLIKAFRH